MGLYNLIKKAAMGAILSGSIALGFGGLENKLHAQVEPPAIEWEKTFGRSEVDSGYFVQQTNDGGFIITGRTFSSGELSSSDVYLIKTDSDGNKLWEKIFGRSGYDEGRSVQQTSDGDYIVLGGNIHHTYLIKTDTNGEKQWEKIFGGPGTSEIHHGESVQQTTDEGYILAGFLQLFAKDLNVYLIKTDTNGEKQWGKTYGGANTDYGLSVQQTTDGGFIITGSTNSFGTDRNEVYLIKTDTNGEKQWGKTFGRTDTSYEGRSVQQTTDGGFIITGRTFSSKEISSGNICLIKTDSDGNKLWEKIFGGDYYDGGFSVQQTTDGGYIVGGVTTNSSDDGRSHTYLIKTDTNGEKQWEKIFDKADDGRSVQQTTDGGYILTGEAWPSVAGGGFNVYLVKLAPTHTIRRATKDSFPQRTPSANNLAFVTHGRTDNADGWVSNIASAILSNLPKNEAQNWDVWTYDWRNESNVSIEEVAVNAADQGKIVGPVLSTAGYEHLHLIAHSAGSWLIEYASRRLENRDSKTIHLTFLDAFALPDSPLGQDADWAEHYVSKGNFPLDPFDIINDPPLTNETLAFAHNIDITGLAPNGGSHWWPYEWYLKSINTESINNSELLSYFRDWGFAKSKEYLGYLPSHDDFKKGETTTLTLNEILLSPNEISNGDFSSGNIENWTVEGEGTVTVAEFPPQSGNLAVQLTAASPVSISQNITTPNSPFILTFENAFLSNSGNTTINLGETMIGRLNSETSIISEPSRNNYIITDSKLRNLETTLNFSFNGDTGSQAILDNISLNAVESPSEFIRGDANADSSFDISDPIHTLLHLYSNIPQPSCKRALDTDDSGKIEISDAIYSLNFLFKAGPSPPSPYPSCNIDRTRDNEDLSCDSYPCQ